MLARASLLRARARPRDAISGGMMDHAVHRLKWKDFLPELLSSFTLWVLKGILTTADSALLIGPQWLSGPVGLEGDTVILMRKSQAQ